MKPKSIIIEGGKESYNYFQDIWNYRELFYILSWRDLNVRYKQTIIGVLWAVIRPLITLVIFSFVFGYIANLASDEETPYFIVVFSGLLPWQFFSNAVNESSRSLIGNERLITKVYFPRIIIPCSTILVSFIDFLIALIILLLLTLLVSAFPSWPILLLPVVFIVLLTLSLGLGFILAALNAKYRDFRYVIPFVLQIGLYLSPIGFKSSLVPEKWYFLYALNPMVGIIEAFRWMFLDQNFSTFPWNSFSISSLWAIILFSVGLIFFKKTERFLADYI